MSLYAKFPELDLRLFTPAELGILSTISPEKQRQCRTKKFTKFLEEREGTGHNRYDWDEVVLWALMAEVEDVGFNLSSAGFFAAAFSKFANDLAVEFGVEGIYVGGQSKGQLLSFDFRRLEDTDHRDLYVACFPEVGRPESFLNVSIFSDDLVPNGRFGFFLNYSDIQRRLLARYETLK